MPWAIGPPGEYGLPDGRELYTFSLVYGSHCVREISYGEQLPGLPEAIV
jgi:hypothetical protein